MKKGLRIFLNTIYTILGIPLGIAGAICLIPFVVFGLIICLPISIVEDIWTPNLAEKYKEK